MTTAAQQWTDQSLEVAGCRLAMMKGGTGDPLFVLHHDIGGAGWLPFYDQLARRFSVYVPSHPGYDQSERPDWMRSVRDVAVVYQCAIRHLGLEAPTLVGLGFGGWIAAEMATMSPGRFSRLVLVGAMGLHPPHGEIFDQALVNTQAYIKTGLQDADTFEATFGADPSVDQLEQWETNREMTFRIAWQPYMYSQTLPYLLSCVDTPALVVWGDQDRIVPLSAGERYAELLPNACLEIVRGGGHFLDLERPDELSTLITAFANE
ncbi:MAG: alpha/beta fold hydrolase [Dehalococcoidia bacterium]